MPQSGPGATTGGSYVTIADEDVNLPNSRRLVAGSNIMLTDGGASGNVTIAATAAPITSSYVTIAPEAGLSNERYLTTTSGLVLQDFGPNTYVELGIFPPTRTQVLANNGLKPMTAYEMIYHKSTAKVWAAFNNVDSPSAGSQNSFNVASITRTANSISSLPFSVTFEVNLASVGANYLTPAVLATCSNNYWFGSSNSTTNTNHLRIIVRYNNHESNVNTSPGTCSVVAFGLATQDI